MLDQSYFSFLAWFALQVILYILLIKLSLKLNLVDIPNERKFHTNLVPRNGGLILFINFIIIFFNFDLNKNYLPFLLANGIIFLGGFIDDLRSNTPAIVKMLFQTTACLVFTLSLPVNYLYQTLFFFFCWGITNSFNLMDNMNGVTGMMLLLYSCVLNYLFGFDVNLLALEFILITSFLLFNFPKARIFLGDQGSQFVGFLTSTALSLVLVKKSPALFFDYNPKDFLLIFSILVCFYAVYIYDTFYVIFIRLKNKKSIFQGDKNHVSHRLHRHGLSIRQVPFAIVALQIPFSLMGFWLFFKL